MIISVEEFYYQNALRSSQALERFKQEVLESLSEELLRGSTSTIMLIPDEVSKVSNLDDLVKNFLERELVSSGWRVKSCTTSFLYLRVALEP